MTVIWREQMSVGNTMIDDEHRYLLCLINTLELAIRTDDPEEIISTTLEQLVDYTRVHFTNEEEIQRKINYPDLQEHRQEHKKIMQDLYEVKEKLDKILSRKRPEKPAPAAEQQEPADIENELEQLLDDESSPRLNESDLTPLIDLARRWIIAHVIGSDLKMKPYLKKHQGSLT